MESESGDAFFKPHHESESGDAFKPHHESESRDAFKPHHFAK